MFTLPAYGDHRDLHSFPTRRSSDLGSCEKYATRFCEQHEKHVCKNNSNQKYAARFDKQYKIEYAGKSNATSKYTARFFNRSEEHTSELQSRPHLVCRLLLEKKKKQ